MDDEATNRPLDVPLDVVAVGAHPDDVEIACGGSLARLVRQGKRVGIVDLTDGEPTPGSSGPAERLEEARAAARVLGVEQRVTLDLPNRRLFDSFEARIALARVLRRWRPALVIGFGEHTAGASPDHWQAMQITDAAVFYARLSKWDEHFPGLPVHSVAAQLYFTLAFRSLEPPAGPGRFVADISDTLEAKIESIRCYRSQFGPNKADIFDRVRAIALTYGQAAGYVAGEPFVSPRLLGTGDLLRTALGR